MSKPKIPITREQAALALNNARYFRTTLFFEHEKANHEMTKKGIVELIAEQQALIAYLEGELK